jgi:hypothetical protein
MIRPAKFADIMRIVELSHEMHERSRYSGVDEVNEKTVRELMAQCIQRHGHTHAGGSLCLVAVRDMKVEGFMVGMLDHLYHIGNKLMAQDIFLYTSDKADALDFMRLLRAYVRWASSNPKVVEIKLSYTDAIEGSDRLDLIYQGLGFRQCGNIYERAPEVEEMVA